MSFEGNLVAGLDLFVHAHIEGVIVVFILGSDRGRINKFTFGIFVDYE